MKRLRIALPAHDIAFGSHAAGDNAEIPGTSAYRSLTSQPDIGAVVILHLHVVVMAVHSFFCGRKVGEEFAERVESVLHHDLAVYHSEALRPFDGFDILVKLLDALGKIRKVDVRK